MPYSGTITGETDVWYLGLVSCGNCGTTEEYDLDDEEVHSIRELDETYDSFADYSEVTCPICEETDWEREEQISEIGHSIQGFPQQSSITELLEKLHNFEQQLQTLRDNGFRFYRVNKNTNTYIFGSD